eukprot:scaffold41415_cov264-Isochrysis_galbana.AAC.5
MGHGAVHPSRASPGPAPPSAAASRPWPDSSALPSGAPQLWASVPSCPQPGRACRPRASSETGYHPPIQSTGRCLSTQRPTHRPRAASRNPRSSLGETERSGGATAPFVAGTRLQCTAGGAFGRAHGGTHCSVSGAGGSRSAPVRPPLPAGVIGADIARARFRCRRLEPPPKARGRACGKSWSEVGCSKHPEARASQSDRLRLRNTDIHPCKSENTQLVAPATHAGGAGAVDGLRERS